MNDFIIKRKAAIFSRFIAKKAAILFISLVCVFSCIPVLILAVGSVTGNYELSVYLEGVLRGQGKTYLLLVPAFPTFQGFIETLFYEPEFYVVFWNSVKLTAFIVAGQMFVAVPAAWGFSRCHGRLASLLFYVYTILMLLPFQVTMLSNYLVIDAIGIKDTHAAVILPAVFSTFPVFLIYRSFLGVPEEVYEAFSLESSSRLRMFYHVGVPLAMPGIKAAALLGVIEYWNMVEQPLLFLKTLALWPFSLYIPGISYDNISYIFVCSLIVMLPMVLLILGGKEAVSEGIGAMAVKK